MAYLAHIAQDNRKQTVLEHLNGTAELCAEFAAAFDMEEQGRLAGLSHDLGKYSDAFQRRLQGSPERVDHSTAGAAECCKLGQNCAAFAVAGHHGGLPDGGGQGDHYEEKTFCGRMKKALRCLAAGNRASCAPPADVLWSAGGDVFYQNALLLLSRRRFPGHRDIYGRKET